MKITNKKSLPGLVGILSEEEADNIAKIIKKSRGLSRIRHIQKVLVLKY